MEHNPSQDTSFDDFLNEPVDVSGVLNQPLPPPETLAHKLARLGTEGTFGTLGFLGSIPQRAVDIIPGVGSLLQATFSNPTPEEQINPQAWSEKLGLPTQAQAKEALVHPAFMKEQWVPDELLGFRGPKAQAVGEFLESVPSSLVEFALPAGLLGKAGKTTSTAKHVANTLIGMGLSKAGEVGAEKLGFDKVGQAWGSILGGMAPDILLFPKRMRAAYAEKKSAIYNAAHQVAQEMGAEGKPLYYRPENLEEGIEKLRAKEANRIQDPHAKTAETQTDPTIQKLYDIVDSHKERTIGEGKSKRVLKRGKEAIPEPSSGILKPEPGVPFEEQARLGYQPKGVEFENVWNPKKQQWEVKETPKTGEYKTTSRLERRPADLTELLEVQKQINEQLRRTDITPKTRSDLMDAAAICNKEISRVAEVPQYRNTKFGKLWNAAEGMHQVEMLASKAANSFDEAAAQKMNSIKTPWIKKLFTPTVGAGVGGAGAMLNIIMQGFAEGGINAIGNNLLLAGAGITLGSGAYVVAKEMRRLGYMIKHSPEAAKAATNLIKGSIKRSPALIQRSLSILDAEGQKLDKSNKQFIDDTDMENRWTVD